MIVFPLKLVGPPIRTVTSKVNNILTPPTDIKVAKKSIMIKNLIEDLGDIAMIEDITIPNVS
jgi:hypothetical protein